MQGSIWFPERLYFSRVCLTNLSLSHSLQDSQSCGLQLFPGLGNDVHGYAHVHGCICVEERAVAATCSGHRRYEFAPYYSELHLKYLWSDQARVQAP